MLARLKRDRKLQLAGAHFEVDPDELTLKMRGTGLLRHFVQRELDKLAKRLERVGHPIGVREGGLIYNLYQTPLPSMRFLNAMSRLVMQGRRPYRPTTCTLQITARCQLNCFHCSAARYRTTEREELTTEEFYDASKRDAKLVLARNDLNKRLNHIQHEHPEAVVSSLHVHVDKHTCMELIVLRGERKLLAELGYRLIGTKGVIHGRVVPSTTGEELK